MRLTDQMCDNLAALGRGAQLSPSRARPLIKRALVTPSGRGYALTEKGLSLVPAPAGR